MTLGELIEYLRAEDPSFIVEKGFHNPHSYRGYYAELAFEPCDAISVGQMLAIAQSALGGVFIGWKGGEFKMHEHTPVWISERGETGESIGPILLWYMMRKA